MRSAHVWRRKPASVVHDQESKHGQSQDAFSGSSEFRFHGRVPRYYISGQYGDQREDKASAFVLQKSPKGNPEAILKAFEDFHRRRQRLIHVGPEKGLRLDEAVLAKSPKKVLELGAYLGYSAIRIARILDDSGMADAHLHSIEKNVDNARLTEGNIAHAGLGHRVTVLRGTPETNEELLRKCAPFDLVFMDHKKLLYYEELKRLEYWGVVQEGTVVVADNIGGWSHQKFGCDYANYVRKSGCYKSQFYWDKRDGIEVSKAIRLAAPRKEGRDRDVMSSASSGSYRRKICEEGFKEVSAGTVNSEVAQRVRRRWVARWGTSGEVEKAASGTWCPSLYATTVAASAKFKLCTKSRDALEKMMSNGTQICGWCQKQAWDGAAGEGRSYTCTYSQFCRTVVLWCLLENLGGPRKSYCFILSERTHADEKLAADIGNQQQLCAWLFLSRHN